jgi:hypothetical protein
VIEIYMDEIRNNGTTERVVLAGVIRNTEDEESLDELQELAVTAGAEVVGIVTQRRDNINTAHYIGKGKLEELKLFVEDREADLVITDDELTGTQIKNIEDYVNVRVIDRTSLILDRVSPAKVPAAEVNWPGNPAFQAGRRHRHPRPRRDKAGERQAAYPKQDKSNRKKNEGNRKA